MGVLELIYDFFEDHVRLAAAAHHRRPMALGVLCFSIGGLSLFVAQALTQRLHLLSFSWTSLAVVLAWKIVAAFVIVAVIHLILEMQGHSGDPVALFVLFGLADLAWTLAVPLTLILRVFSRSPWAVTAVFMAVGFLSLSLKARSLQDGYRISAGKAWFTLGLPYIAVVSGTLLVISLLIMRLIVEAAKAFG